MNTIRLIVSILLVNIVLDLLCVKRNNYFAIILCFSLLIGTIIVFFVFGIIAGVIKYDQHLKNQKKN